MSAPIQPRTLHDHHRHTGATLAADGIPLHYDDATAEYNAIHQSVAVFDRSHEARLQFSGGSAGDILQRISTNDILSLQPGDGCTTVFTNPIGRILAVADVFRTDVSTCTLLGGPGQSAWLAAYLGRNTFFQDDATVTDLSGTSRQISLHGPHVMQALQQTIGIIDTGDDSSSGTEMRVTRVDFGGTQVGRVRACECRRPACCHRGR